MNARSLFASLLLAMLTACGGGGDDTPPDQPPPGVDCKVTPEKCK